MSDHVKSTVDQPLRSSFLCHLRGDERETVEDFAFLFEAAILEWIREPPDEAVNVRFTRATLEDLAALLLHQRHAVGDWNSTAGTAPLALHEAMIVALGLLEDAYRKLSKALGEDPLGDRT